MSLQILFIVLGGLALLLLAGGVIGFFWVKRYLARSQEGVKDTMSDIAEEIDSFQEKTQ